MARVAFIMDRFFRQFGMSGKSFIPLLISAGCGVPVLWLPVLLKMKPTAV